MKLITKVQRRLKQRNGLPEGAKDNDFVSFIRERYVRVYASIKFITFYLRTIVCIITHYCRIILKTVYGLIQ